MFTLRNRFKKSTSQQSYNLHIRAKKTYLNDYISSEFYNDLGYNNSTNLQQSNYNNQQYEFNNNVHINSVQDFNNLESITNQNSNESLNDFEKNTNQNSNESLNDFERNTDQDFNDLRSEEHRVGKECRSRWS